MERPFDHLGKLGIFNKLRTGSAKNIKEEDSREFAKGRAHRAEGKKQKRTLGYWC